MKQEKFSDVKPGELFLLPKILAKEGDGEPKIMCLKLKDGSAVNLETFHHIKNYAQEKMVELYDGKIIVRDN